MLVANRVLYAARRERQLTQMGLAALARTSPTSVVFYEKYGGRPRRAVRERLARVLGVPADTLWPATDGKMRSP